MRRALFGGSFDPFHDGHLAMIRATLARGLADLVLVVPAAHNPHKPDPCASPADRLRMAQLGTAGLAGVDVLDDEVGRPGPSWTIDTLEALARRHPDGSLRLILGADNLPEFHRWRGPQRILELADLLVFPRGEGAVAPPPALASRTVAVAGFSCPVSSTAVREALAAGRRPTGLVPPTVLRYIEEHALYGRASAGPAGAPRGAGEGPCH